MIPPVTTIDMPLRTEGTGTASTVRPGAPQQPQWGNDPRLAGVKAQLAAAPALVTPRQLRQLRAALATVAVGRGRVLQAGDCAESFYECRSDITDAKVNALNRMADRLSTHTATPVVRIGRIGGQYAKPRSSPYEVRDGVELPSFRGHLVNSELPDLAARAHDPRRMLWAYHASARVLERLGEHRARLRRPAATYGLWSSHEALVLDYETALLRQDTAVGENYLASTHLPWIGKRTGDIDGSHVELLAGVTNPVGYKVGPDTTPSDLVGLCGVLDPDRTPGRLVLIARLGRAAVADVLPGQVAAVRDAGHPVVWLCDPMHGNTITTSDGYKTRRLSDLIAEARQFRSVLEREAVPVGGLHLESSGFAADITECVGGSVTDERQVGHRYTTLCDPRLTTDQAMELIDACFGV